MSLIPQSLQKLINHLEKLPSIGSKTAIRLAYFYVVISDGLVKELIESVEEIRKNLRLCKYCYNVCESEVCEICSSSLRDKNKICIVEAPLDILNIEQTKIYNGKYFVLSGLINPLKGIGPQDIRLQELSDYFSNLLKNIKDAQTNNIGHNNERVDKEKLVESELKPEPNNLEIIIALNPSLEGETTSIYIKRTLDQLFKKYDTINYKMSRLGIGLPKGADVDYADELTLQRAFEGRTIF